MASIQFYHLTATPLERALPKLLEKIIASGFKVALVTDSEEKVDALNQLLWTYDPASFLPHGSAKDGDTASQPIFITTAIEAPNQANILVLTNGATIEGNEPFERIVDIFDGNDDQKTADARTRWAHYKNAGHTLAYLQQSAQGSWQQKAAA